MVAETALYDTLGITPSASAQEIKTAYRKMALKYHPDKNNGDESAAEKFKKISEAYEILGDDDKRKQYDTYGKERAMNGAGGGPGFPSGVDPMDIFQQFFNFGGGGRSGGGGAANQARQKRKPKLTAIVLQCSLEELYCGTTKVLEIERLRLCPQCKGHGTANGKPVPNCRMCGGHGIRQQRLRLPSGQVILQQAQCSACRGTGKSDNIHPCPRCSSSTLAGGVKGVVMRRHRVQVVIEPGTEDSDSYSFPNEGDEVPNYDEPGDIIVVVEELAHPNFRRLNGNDLILLNCSIPLSFLFQPKCEIPVELLDGRIVRLAAPMLSTGPQFLLSSQHAFTVVGEGMPVKGKSGEKGKLVIVVHVRFPKSLSAKQQDQICSALGHQPQPHSSDVKEVILRPYHGETLGSLYVDPKSGNATNISPPKNKKDTPKQAGAKPRFAFASSSSGCQQQ